MDRLDGVLRRRHGVREYTDDPDCVFRIAPAKADRPLLLADGTFVHPGAVVCCLHFWNEHLPRFPSAGPDLGWAKIMRSRLRRSLQELCAHMERDPAWLDVKALRADAPLPFRPLAREQMQRLAQRHGFEAERDCGTPRGRIRAAAENMLLWGFARAYNPVALARHDLRQGRQSLWLSRKALQARYGTMPADSRGRSRGGG